MLKRIKKIALKIYTMKIIVDFHMLIRILSFVVAYLYTQKIFRE